MVLLLIAAGFLGAYWVQGKGWDNHAYPVIGFCLIAAALAASSGAPRWPGLPGWLGPATLGLALVLAAPRYWKADSGRPALAAAIQQIHSHPKMLVLGLPISLGHPLVRDIGGSYAGSVASLWITPGALLMKERAGDDSALVARAGAWFEKDRLLAVRDIEIKKPDIVLVQIHPDFDFPAWIAASAPLQAAMSHYQWIGIVDGAQIFSRR